ncbi:MAG TPA: PEP/pyruvate-binding domain-containing protein [Anaerolineae bacterium]|nr:PEP/pyruvate-binding domain-containing protein [Anaerolineae bacterium]
MTSPKSIYNFSDFPHTLASQAGGKAATLARLYQLGHPVPPGLILLPTAFTADGTLTPTAHQTLTATLPTITTTTNPRFAVRSSSPAEDSAIASFAGEFDTKLNISPEQLPNAITTVYKTNNNERVRVYRQAKGLDHTPTPMAVIIQQMVPATHAGVLFTVDPINPNPHQMSGNFVLGLGEALVSGQTNATAFTYNTNTQTIDAPADLAPTLTKLCQLAQQIADQLVAPQDIEWALVNDQIHILQARPITTPLAYNPATGQTNATRLGHYLWTNGNVGEGWPYPMTPITWSFAQILLPHAFAFTFQKDEPIFGLIGGRIYVNYSLFLDITYSLPLIGKFLRNMLKTVFNEVPPELDYQPRKRPLTTIFHFFRDAINAQKLTRQLTHTIDSFLANLPAHFETTKTAIATTDDPQALFAIYEQNIEPLLPQIVDYLTVPMVQLQQQYDPLHQKLTKLVGSADATAILSGFNNDTHYFESLGPLITLDKVAKGELSPDQYAHQYGHRAPHEAEIAYPRPVEDPNWLNNLLAQHAAQHVDIPGMLAQRQKTHQEAWQRLQTKAGWQINRLEKQVKNITFLLNQREHVRSELVRTNHIARQIWLKLGRITTLNDDIFHLYLPELRQLIYNGDTPALAYLSARRQTYDHYTQLPNYPALIYGRFNPHQWAQNPNRRSDFFTDQQNNTTNTTPVTNILHGAPGAAGTVTGTVRVITNLDDSDQIQPGDILVTTFTNIGWTVIFPLVTAIVTDVGATLSHAAIVARELGIPAVVGCGHATTTLKTGMTVRVNGQAGTVEILSTQPTK